MEQELKQKLQDLFQKDMESASDAEIYTALLAITKEKMSAIRPNTGKRKLYYISAEFLIGKLLSNNLINLGLFEETKEVLAKYGHELTAVEEAEMEPSLGNGGLGRLAACFLDSIATLGLPGDGVGLNYHEGLFLQKFSDHKQWEDKNPCLSGRSSGSPARARSWWLSSATALWSRLQDSGPPVIWRSMKEYPPKQPPSMPACFSSASLRAGPPADF